MPAVVQRMNEQGSPKAELQSPAQEKLSPLFTEDATEPEPDPRLCSQLHLYMGLLLNATGRISSVAQSCPTLRDPMDQSVPGLPVHHQLPESTQTHLH